MGYMSFIIGLAVLVALVVGFVLAQTPARKSRYSTGNATRTGQDQAIQSEMIENFQHGPPASNNPAYNGTGRASE